MGQYILGLIIKGCETLLSNNSLAEATFPVITNSSLPCERTYSAWLTSNISLENGTRPSTKSSNALKVVLAHPGLALSAVITRDKYFLTFLLGYGKEQGFHG